MAEYRMAWQEFLECAEQFLALSDSLADGWTLQGAGTGPGGTYLCKRHQSSSEMDSTQTPTHLEDSTLEEQDSQETSHTAPSTVTSEYHVVYSLSYQVPVLYFNVWRGDGSLLSLDQVWGRVPRSLQAQSARWSTVTQQEHPLLRRPYFQLHPCHTAELLAQVPGVNRIVGWLSAVGPAAGLCLPLAYGASPL